MSNILAYKGYQGSFEYDQKADIFHGDVLHITDVVTFQGRSIDDLKQALADSIEDYLEFCAKIGREPNKPYSGSFNVRIPPEIHQHIATLAHFDGISINKWIAKTLSEAVQTKQI